VGKIESTIESFYECNKPLFLKSYSELSDGEKFYTLSATLLTLANLEFAKDMYLEELRSDLTILKTLNKPDNKHIGKLPENYQSYWNSSVVSETITKFEKIAQKLKQW
jgi:hypothetical protein